MPNSTVGLRETSQVRTHFEGKITAPSQSSDLTGEGTVAAQWMARKFPVLTRPLLEKLDISMQKDEHRPLPCTIYFKNYLKMDQWQKYNSLNYNTARREH